MEKVKIFIVIFFMCSFCIAKTQQEEYQNDILYSEEYFDYLIENASIQNQENIEKNKKNEIDEIALDETKENNDEEITATYEPFKLRIENNKISKYTENFQKEDTKAAIPITSKLNLYQNTTRFRNKYNSNDYRVMVGAEYNFNKYFNIASGLETNYRNLDQTPISKKIYITPSLNINDKIAISFYNKFYTQSNTSDHDIGISISPFKSKKMDFGIYAGLTKDNSSLSESISFSTNLYF